GADTYLVVLTEAEEGSEGSEGSSSGSSSSSSSSSGSSSSSSSTSPKTDDINMAPYVTLCVLALAGAVVAGKKAFAK
ncbi:MAG: hypothetical protein LIO95_08235, partial [Clostridiales bacterium]|nr:hypothetical protein [Clostridiales bacterium]